MFQKDFCIVMDVKNKSHVLVDEGLYMGNKVTIHISVSSRPNLST